MNANPMREKIAIVGMGVHLGSCTSLEEYYLSVLLGRQHFRPLPPDRWKGLNELRDTLAATGLPDPAALRGAWVEELTIDPLRFKIHSEETQHPTQQQLLMLHVAEQAIQDAGLADRAGPGANIAVIIAMETELEIHHCLSRWQVPTALDAAGIALETRAEHARTDALKNAVFSDHEHYSPSERPGFTGNIIASCIAALLDFTGPAFTVSSGENGVCRALEIAQNLLASGEVEAVVLGAVDLGGGLESVLARHAAHPVQAQPSTMSWNQGTTGWAIGEGAGAIVLKRAADATNDRIYAHLDSLAIVQAEPTGLGGAPTAAAVAEAARQALAQPGLEAAAIGLLEVSGSGIAAEDAAEMAGLTQAYQGPNGALTCALGSSKAHVGHTFEAAGLAAIIKSALALYYRFLPGVPGWQGPASAALAGSRFYVPELSRPWLPGPAQPTLRAAVSSLAADGTSAHLLLSEGSHPVAGQPSPYLLRGGERLFPLRAASVEGLQPQLAEVEAQLATSSYWQLSDQLCTALGQLPAGETLVLVAASGVELGREIRFFRQQLAAGLAPGASLQTPAGSFYTTRPLGAAGKLALVYPGSGSPYLGLGAMLLQAFPMLYDELGTHSFDSTVALNGPLYPRQLFAPSQAQQQAQEQAFQADAMTMILVGCTFARLYTKVLQEGLGVRADAVLGHSMGETSAMWYSQQLWDTTQVNEKFLQASLFREKMGGRLTLLADVWQLPEAEARARWSTRLLHQPAGRPGYASLADWFRAEVQPWARRVYLTFINTDTEIILSGDGPELDELLSRWQLPNVPLTINNATHHDFCRELTADLLTMHHQPIQGTPDKVYYSGVTAAPLPVTTEGLAHNALEVCCQPIDWPRLVRQVAADGYALFLEIGPNATCSRWIQELLPGPRYAALPMDRKGASVLRSLTGLMARLLAHGVPVSLAPFYEPAPARPPTRKTLHQTLRTGGSHQEELVLTPANRQLFAAARRESAPALVAELATPVLGALPTAGEPAFRQQASCAASLTEMALTPAAPVAENGLALQDYTSTLHLQGKTVIWDEADLLTFATGRIQDVFGPAYAPIDAYRRRVMLPMPPYLLVSRVTHLDAARHEYRPSRLTTEYDIPYHSAFATDGQIPWAVVVESGQCDLLLISYLGVDFQNRGEYVYRLLDCTLTFTDDLPFEGQTLRYDLAIDRFVRSGDTLLFFFHYRCYVADRLVLKLDGGCAGFFSDADLALGQGVVLSPAERRERASRPRQFFAPLLECAKTAFSTADLLALVRGDVVSCFGEAYQPHGRNPSLRLPPREILLLDRITRVDRQGGSAGLGYLEAEKDLDPDDWYFPCHFRDDQVLAGSLQAEGGGQLLRFYLLLLGMQRLTKDARFQPVLDRPQKVRCRREVPAKAGKLLYQLDVKEIGLVPQPYVVADLAIVYQGQVAVYFENLGLRLQEKSEPAYRAAELPRQQGVYVKPIAGPVLFSEYHITQLALGSVHRCFGDEYRGFEGRPLLRLPNTDLQLISRVLSSTGTRRVFNGKPVLVSEYDVPADAWYFTQNAAPVMPYSILMEIALQPCGFLGAYLGTALLFPDKELFLRTPDGDGNLLRDVELRGQTITNRVCLLSHTTLGGIVLQRYSYELSVEGEPFYRGTASFGCFTRDDLTNQVGLDRGTHVAPWHETARPTNGLSFKLNSLFGRLKLYQAPDPAAPQLHLASGQLNLLDTALVVPGGGRYEKGYVFARRAIEVHHWFFACHFYQDPVMPGSLGVEAMLQALQVFALQQNLAAGRAGATFQQLAPHQTKWKYRGQLQTTDAEMSLELHLKTIEHTVHTITLIADASLWRGPLRVYEVTDLGLVIQSQ